MMHELNEKTDKATVKRIALQKQSTYVKEREATVAAISELSREVFERGDRLVQEGGGSKGAGPQVFGEAQLLFTSANSLPAILNCLIPLIFSPCYLLMIQLVPTVSWLVSQRLREELHETSRFLGVWLQRDGKHDRDTHERLVAAAYASSPASAAWFGP